MRVSGPGLRQAQRAGGLRQSDPAGARRQSVRPTCRARRCVLRPGQSGKRTGRCHRRRVIEREAAQRKSAAIKSRRLELPQVASTPPRAAGRQPRWQATALGRETEPRQRAAQYVQMARTEGCATLRQVSLSEPEPSGPKQAVTEAQIGTLVLKMPVDDKRKFFRAASSRSRWTDMAAARGASGQ